VTVTSSAPLGKTVNGAIWSGFALSGVLPSDAAIVGIYPVLVASSVNADALYQYLSSGTGLSLVDPGTSGSGFTSGPISPTAPKSPGASFSSGTFLGASIGASLSALAGQQIGAWFSDSLGPYSGYDDTITVTAVGYAIDYTSATPFTDPQIAPPFTVLSGHGLAWALPAATDNTGSSGTGVSSSTACVYNGGLAMSSVAMLWRLAANDRSRSVDVTRLSRMSIPIEEYR
jgi:hypothetical protein